MLKRRPDELSIYARVPLNYMLMDKRVGRRGLKFGTVYDICLQYGIRCEVMKNCFKFTAPKSRLQMFAEKLHFSMVKYREMP